ncbi:MAG: M28 family metallopeptidase [Promethearchaeota archaeon]
MDFDEISQELSQDGIDLIKEICTLARHRLPGSENEKIAQEFIKNKMKKFGADEIELQEFKVHAKFFRWWPVISGVMFFASLVCYLFIPLLALILAVLMVLNIFFKLFSYDFLDIFFKNKPSLNIIGKLKARNDQSPKLLLILGGHTDSNYEYPIGSKFGTKLILLFIPAILLMFIWIITTTIKFIRELVETGNLIILSLSSMESFTSPRLYDWLFYITIALSPFMGWLSFRMISSNPVPGANDNLSGIAVIMELLKFYSKNDAAKPRNVELWFVAFGSEEGGMKGSKFMAKKVRKAINNGSCPARRVWVINFDSIGADGPLHIASKEPLYRCKYLPDVYTQLAKSAENAGVEYYVKSLAAGTDSAPFGRLKIPATGVLAFGTQDSPPNWHSLNDTPENVDVKGLYHSIKLAMQFIKDLDDSLEN